MNVNELLTFPETPAPTNGCLPSISENTSLTSVIAAMTESESNRINILSDDGIQISATAWQALNAVASMMPHSPEVSEIEILCHPSRYSASSVARAVEDADAALLTLLTYPAKHGMLNIYIRTNRSDPSSVVHSLERYGYEVSAATGPEYTDADTANKRLCELQHYLNI